MVERFNWYLEAIGCEMWLVFSCPWTIMLRFQQYYSKFPRLIWMLTHKCIAENWFEFHLFKPIPKNLLLISFECANTLPISLWHERIRICRKLHTSCTKGKITTENRLSVIFRLFRFILALSVFSVSPWVVLQTI